MPELDVPIDIDDSTFRDKIALALSRLPQADVDGIVKRLAAEAKTGETKAAHALARLADQAFGRIPQADTSDHGDSEIWANMPREKRAALAATLIREAEELEAAAASSPDTDSAAT